MTTRLTIDEQVDCIVRLMATGQWKGMASAKRLASEWQVHPRTVGDRAVVASGFLKRSGGDLEAWVNTKLAELEQIKATAMTLKKAIVVEGTIVYHASPDVKGAILAVRTQLEIRGQLTKRVEVTKGEPIAPTDDKRAVAAKLQAALDEVNAQIQAEEPVH